MWGANVNETTTFTFDISDPDDPNNEATVNVVVQDGNVVITATNFHYSAPTLSVRAVTAAPVLPETGNRFSTSVIIIAMSLLFVGLSIIVGRRRIVN
jgi:LPXTG-motif cell wall-anchored protein